MVRQAHALRERGLNRWEIELEFKRIRFAFSKDKFNQVDILSKRNGELAKLLQMNDELGVSRKQRQQGSTTTLFRSIRDHARDLFAAFNESWHCQCQEAHPVGLRMERRLKEVTADERHLKLLLSKSIHADGITTKEVEVHVTDALALDNPCSKPSEDTTPPPTSQLSLYKTKSEVDAGFVESATIERAEQSLKAPHLKNLPVPQSSNVLKKAVGR